MKNRHVILESCNKNSWTGFVKDLDGNDLLRFKTVVEGDEFFDFMAW